MEQLAVPTDAMRKRGDPDDLSRLLRDVLGNAVRHARHAVCVRNVEGAHNRVRIEIEDDGPGVGDGAAHRGWRS